MMLKSERIFFIAVRLLIFREVMVVLSSANPSFLEVSLFDSYLKKSGRVGLRIGLALGLGMGSIEGSSSILKIKICIQKLKVWGEMLSP